MRILLLAPTAKSRMTAKNGILTSAIVKNVTTRMSQKIAARMKSARKQRKRARPAIQAPRPQDSHAAADAADVPHPATAGCSRAIGAANLAHTTGLPIATAMQRITGRTRTMRRIRRVANPLCRPQPGRSFSRQKRK